jgi:hypothetical protein
MSSARAPPSPYAGNHNSTPIASAKRSKATGAAAAAAAAASSRPLNSPMKGGESATCAKALAGLDDGDDDIDYPIFSPALHVDGSALEEHRHHADHHAPVHQVPHHVEYDAAEELAEQGEEEEEEEEEFNPFLFMHALPAHASVQIKGKLCLPPKKTDRLTLTLDLDETLVHCTVDPVPNPDHIFNVVFNDNSYQVYVRKRPYLDYFLESVSKQFEVRATVCVCVLYCIVLYCTVLYCTVLYRTVLCYTVLYCAILYCIVLYCVLCLYISAACG